MRRLRNVFIIFLGLFLMTGCLKSEAEKNRDRVNKILNHLEKKYGEKFYMSSPFGGRGQNDALRIMVKPERYRGTTKEYDDFYEDYAFIKTDGKIGDAFGTIYLKEGAEEYFKPKLKELFGENVLIAIVPEGRYVFVNFKKEMERRSNVYNSNPIGNYSPLSGGIYIFGRVKSEADREYYRKQIYEFIQYLKAENMFDYTLLKIRVIDERVLTKGYRNNDNKINTNLIELINDKSLDRKEYSEKRVNLMSQFDIEYNKMTDKEKEEAINKYSKAALGESYIKVFGKGTPLLSFFTYSPKYIISRGWDRDKNSDDYEKVKYYDKIEEVDLSEGW
ncbi:MAG: hypothetical protein RR523_00785 [Cetobacterium sp.]|uniref:hypothetical protein n=1 Tax=Cetobacterium sp. TaxID=2071632 RepID=UPI002FCA234C